MMTFDEFLSWEARVKPEIGKIGGLLSEELSDDPSSLIEELLAIEALGARCGYMLAEANSFLDRFSLTAMPPKGEYTEKHREVLMDSQTAPIRLVRDILERYCDSINRRISLGQTILKTYKEFNPLVKEAA